MSSIQPISGFRAQQTSFGGRHLPRNFSSMMNYIYKKLTRIIQVLLIRTI